MRARINKSKSPSAGKKPAGGFPIKNKNSSPLKFMSFNPFFGSGAVNGAINRATKVGADAFEQQTKQQVAQKEQLNKSAATQPILNGAKYDTRNSNYNPWANNYNTRSTSSRDYENPNTNQTPLMSKKQRK
jgi:hypothetical protein